MTKPDIVVTSERRLEFARFLERLAAHEASRDEWLAAVVEHYPDKLLESVRRECVRILYKEPNAYHPIPRLQQQLRAWAEALRRSASADPDTPAQPPIPDA